MKKIIAPVLVMLVISIFCGYFIISMGLGSLYPSLYKVTTPFVCNKNQSLEVIQRRHSWRPGTVMLTASVYRVNTATGVKEDQTSFVKFVAGVIYGIMLFVLFLPRIFCKSIHIRLQDKEENDAIIS